jgi:hypothetical protein
MQVFSADATMFSKKFKLFFLPLKTWKNHPQKLLIIGPDLFLCTGLAAQTAQKQKSRSTKSPLMQDWVFRLGL